MIVGHFFLSVLIILFVPVVKHGLVTIIRHGQYFVM